MHIIAADFNFNVCFETFLGTIKAVVGRTHATAAKVIWARVRSWFHSRLAIWLQRGTRARAPCFSPPAAGNKIAVSLEDQSERPITTTNSGRSTHVMEAR